MIAFRVQEAWHCCMQRVSL